MYDGRTRQTRVMRRRREKGVFDTNPDDRHHVVLFYDRGRKFKGARVDSLLLGILTE